MSVISANAVDLYGSFTKAGAGKLVLSAPSSAYAPDSNIYLSGGILEVNNASFLAVKFDVFGWNFGLW